MPDAGRAWAKAAQANPAPEPESPGFSRELTTVIDGPRGMAAVETIRSAFDSLGEARASDVFIWGLGEPEHPAATKLGGLPYRPADEPWPMSAAGRPLSFMAQVCFADSKDLVGVPGSLLRKPRPLPGDVLLMFAPGDYLADWDDDDQSSLVFEWRSLGLADPVRKVPPTAKTFAPAFAQIHRTADFPEPADDHPVRMLFSGRDLCIVRGTKIGGVPAFDGMLPGRHLCTLSSLNPSGGHFPLLNAARPQDIPSGLLMMGDLGLLHLFIDAAGKIRWTVRGG